MIEVRVEESKSRKLKVKDVQPGDIFFLPGVSFETYLMTTSEKDGDSIAVVLETGESVFLKPSERVSRVATDARLYVKD
jgi:hypothetical protein